MRGGLERVSKNCATGATFRAREGDGVLSFDGTDYQSFSDGELESIKRTAQVELADFPNQQHLTTSGIVSGREMRFLATIEYLKAQLRDKNAN